MATNKAPAGSLEPIGSRPDKWWDGINASDMSQLQGIAREINKTADKTIKTVARAKIRIGKLLLEARALLPADQAFSKWRLEHTPIQSKQHAHYLMQIAERFAGNDKLIEGANYSILQELVLATPDDIEWIEQKIDEGKVPKIKEVREHVKESRGLVGTSKKSKAAAGGINYAAPLISPHEAVNALVQLEWRDRIAEIRRKTVKQPQASYVILGMDPDPQCPMNPDTLTAICDYWTKEADTLGSDEEQAIIANAIEKVQDDQNEFK